MKSLHLLNQAHQSKLQLYAGETGSILTGFIYALPSIIFSFSLGFPVAALADTCVPATSDGAGLQACLDSAFDGDTILLPAGTYAPVVERVPGDSRSVTFDLSKSVILESYAGAILSGDLNDDDDGAGGNTGDNAKNVIRSTSGSALQITLRGLTIRGGNGSVGAGILIANNNTSLTIDDVDFSGNRASAWGGGLYMRGSTLNIHKSSFTNNAAGITGGGINIAAPTMVSIENSAFSENHARVGGGINIQSSLDSFSDVSITASSFADNTANSGGAIRAFFSFVDIDGSTFIGNSAANQGGALHLQEMQAYHISDSEFMGNQSDFGGALMAWGNSVLQVEGEVIDSSFSSNYSSDIGGAIALGEGVHRMIHNTFAQNEAENSGGAIILQGFDENAGSGFNDPGYYTLEDNHFTGNSASSGGGGAILAVSVAKLTLTKNHYRGNYAGVWAGAVGVGLPAAIANFIGAPLDENLEVSSSKEHYQMNSSEGLPEFNLGVGGVYLARSEGNMDKAQFTHNESEFGVDTLKTEDSPNFSFGKVKIAEVDSEDCSIDGSIECP